MVADLLAISLLFPFVHLPTTLPKCCNPDLRPSHPSLLPPFMFLSSNPSTVLQSFLCFSPASHFLSFGRFHLCPAMVLSDFSLEFRGLSSLAMLALPPPTFCFSFSFFLSLPLVTFSGIFLPKGCLAAADVLFFGFGFEFVGISCVFGRDLLCWFLQMVACWTASARGGLASVGHDTVAIVSTLLAGSASWISLFGLFVCWVCFCFSLNPFVIVAHVWVCTCWFY